MFEHKNIAICEHNALIHTVQFSAMEHNESVHVYK